MDEMNGAFEEKKRRKGGKRLMQPEKAAKAPKAPRAEKPPQGRRHRRRCARGSVLGPWRVGVGQP